MTDPIDNTGFLVMVHQLDALSEGAVNAIEGIKLLLVDEMPPMEVMDALDNIKLVLETQREFIKNQVEHDLSMMDKLEEVRKEIEDGKR